MNLRIRKPAALLAIAAPVLLLGIPHASFSQERTIQESRAQLGSAGTAGEESLRSLLGSAGDERRIARRSSRQKVGAIRSVARQLREGASFPDVRRDWARAVAGSPHEDVDALVQWVLREAYGEQLEDLRAKAAALAERDAAKAALRKELARVRAATRSRAGGQRGERLGAFEANPEIASLLETPQVGRTPAQAARTDTTQIAVDLRAYEVRLRQRLAELGDDLDTIGDDGQLANLELQHALQRQQQLLQMLSNVSKQLHDTAMSVIRRGLQ
jgi:hypothetical protein